MYYLVDLKFNMLYGYNNFYNYSHYDIFLTNSPLRAISFPSFHDAQQFANENCLTNYTIEFID